MFEFIPHLSGTEAGCPLEYDPVIVLSQKNVIIAGQGESYRLPLWHEVRPLLSGDECIIRVGRLDGRECFALEIAEVAGLPGNLVLQQIRRYLFEFPEAESMALCRAKGLLHWRKQHRYCGACRSKLCASENDSGVICPSCGMVYYPQLAPAVIVAVTRSNGRELLLAHNRNFAGNMYSLIAGFVEAGESVEAAVNREIREETSLTVKNLRYITSQVWPFPNSLMLAFQAEYDSGEALPDGEELTDLGWFTAEKHPELPSHGSVAREVIDLIFNPR